MLMSRADSKQGKNRSGVRMFKDGKEGNSGNGRDSARETDYAKRLQCSRGLVGIYWGREPMQGLVLSVGGTGTS